MLLSPAGGSEMTGGAIGAVFGGVAGIGTFCSSLQIDVSDNINASAIARMNIRNLLGLRIKQ
jgi:hypothetical protein